jgi:BirA family biotin operon repressor/biotin-[acetyl-CoA-carboxylase] ligase
MDALSFQVLRHLHDARFHSGAVLARELGVSRGTVWNAVRTIEASGLRVYKVRGRGYRLAQAVSMLDATAVRTAAGGAGHRLAIEVVDTCASTNSVLMRRAADGGAGGAVLAAEWQQSGRGRMGRPWHAGPCGALTFSLLWRFAQGAGALAGLSLAVGVAVIRALDDTGVKNARLKWPNDVLWQGRKIAGVLVEMHGDALGPSTVVIGIGVNVRLSEHVARRIDQPATDLAAACGDVPDRSPVLGIVLARLVEVLDIFGASGFAPLREEWQRYHAHQGQRVAIRLPTGRLDRGVALGVAEDGALLFRSGSAVRRLHSGEITLRPGASIRHSRGNAGAARGAG